MVRLASLPELSIISGFKKSIDYYVWKGIFVARKWPRKSTYTPSPQEQQSRQDFGDNLHALSSLPGIFITQVEPLIKGSSWTWRDYWFASLYGHYQTWR